MITDALPEDEMLDDAKPRKRAYPGLRFVGGLIVFVACIQVGVGATLLFTKAALAGLALMSGSLLTAAAGLACLALRDIAINTRASATADEE